MSCGAKAVEKVRNLENGRADAGGTAQPSEDGNLCGRSEQHVECRKQDTLEDKSHERRMQETVARRIKWQSLKARSTLVETNQGIESELG